MSIYGRDPRVQEPVNGEMYGRIVQSAKFNGDSRTL